MKSTRARIVSFIVIGSLCYGFNHALYAEEDENQNLKDAKLALSQGQAQAALVEIQDVLKDSPHDPEALLLFAKAKLAIHETQSAITVLQMLRAQGRPWHEWMVPLGIAYIETAQFQKVLDEIWVMDKSTAVGSLLENVSLLRGHAAIQLNKNEEAQSWYEKVLAINPKSQDAALGLSKVALNAQDYAAAEKYAIQALWYSHRHKKAEVLAYLGEINYKNNRLETAHHYFEEAMTQNPALLSARLGLAQLAYQAKDFALFSKLMEPLSHGAHLPIKAQYYMGVNHLLHNRFDEAEVAFKRVLQEKPDQMSLMVLAKINIEKQLWSEARHHLKQVLLENPNQQDAKRLLTYVLIQQNDYQEAMQIMPEGNWDLRALADLNQKKYTEFEVDQEAWQKNADLERPLKLSQFLQGDDLPKAFLNDINQNETALFSQYLRVQAALMRHDLTAAKPLIDAFLEKHPNHFLSSLVLADLFYQKKDYQEAKKHYLEALKQEPAYLEIEIKLAECHLQLKQDTAAIHLYEHLRSENKLNLSGLLKAADRLHEARNAIKEEEWLKWACLKFPKEIDPQLRLIQKLLHENRVTEAGRRADILYEQYPKQALVLQLQGGLARKRGDLVKASAYFKALTEATPNEASAWVFLAESLKTKQEVAEANTALDKALTLQDDFLPAYVLKAKWELEAHHLQPAMEAIAHARKLAPNDADIALLEGDIFFADKKLEQAEQVYTVAYQLNPSKEGAFALFRTKRAKGEREASTAILTGFARAHAHDLSLQEEIQALLETAS